MSEVVVRDLRVDLPGRARVLDGVSFEVDAGSFVRITGANASGKSTLALALLGVLEDTLDADVAGRIEIGGADMLRADGRHRAGAVAGVWQRPEAQLFRPTVLDEARAAADFRCVSAGEADASARTALDVVGLGHIDEQRDPVTLSGGEQQRLALAAVLGQDAPVLVLDEATSALDPAAARQFTHALQRVRAERPLTIIAIEHRAVINLPADRTFHLVDGRLTPGAPLEPARSNAPELPHPHDAAPALRLTEVASDRPRLEPVTAAFGCGSVVLVTGANGTGKSTLLRAIAGELRVAGRIEPRRRLRAGIGFAPQGTGGVFLTTTVRAELATVSDAPDALIEQLGLPTDAHPLRLSGGMRQRLAVALAVADSTAIALLDEPTSAQDADGVARIRRVISAGAGERVTLIASHDAAVFAGIATHRIHLGEGA